MPAAWYCVNDQRFYLGVRAGGHEEAFALEVGLFGLMHDDFDAGGELAGGTGSRSAHVFVLFGIEDESESVSATRAVDEGPSTIRVESVANAVFRKSRREVYSRGKGKEGEEK